jgi:hypothetical protein
VDGDIFRAETQRRGRLYGGSTLEGGGSPVPELHNSRPSSIHFEWCGTPRPSKAAIPVARQRSSQA